MRLQKNEDNSPATKIAMFEPDKSKPKRSKQPKNTKNNKPQKVKNNKTKSKIKSKYRRLYLNTSWDNRTLNELEYFCKPNHVTYHNFIKFDEYLSSIGNLDENHKYLIDFKNIHRGIVKAKKANIKDKEYHEYSDYKKLFSVLAEANLPVFNNGIPNAELVDWNYDTNPHFTLIRINSISYEKIDKEQENYLLDLMMNNFPQPNRRWRIDKNNKETNILILKSFDHNDDVKLIKDYANFINYEIARIRSHHNELYYSHIDVSDVSIDDDGKVIEFTISFIEGHNLYDINNLKYFARTLISIMRDNDFYSEWIITNKLLKDNQLTFKVKE